MDLKGEVVSEEEEMLVTLIELTVNNIFREFVCGDKTLEQIMIDKVERALGDDHVHIHAITGKEHYPTRIKVDMTPREFIKHMVMLHDKVKEKLLIDTEKEELLQLFKNNIRGEVK